MNIEVKLLLKNKVICVDLSTIIKVFPIFLT